ncbi:MAG TPA: carbonic anhydrase, partial [Chitinophagaceae bacterium]|nr:carbonic anhydrase [Chitinophagaceae bacterium]
RNEKNETFLRNVTVNNVFITVKKVTEQSPILHEMEKTGQIKIIGGLYDVDTGHVTFFEN